MGKTLPTPYDQKRLDKLFEDHNKSVKKLLQNLREKVKGNRI